MRDGKKVTIEFDVNEIKVLVAEILANKLSKSFDYQELKSIKRNAANKVTEDLAAKIQGDTYNA